MVSACTLSRPETERRLEIHCIELVDHLVWKKNAELTVIIYTNSSSDHWVSQPFVWARRVCPTHE